MGHTLFDEVASFENLLSAWKEFRRGKRKKQDVQEFEFSLEDNLFELHEQLKSKIYRHSNYTAFYVQDPKLRHIHKAAVRDRVIHQAIFRVLYQIFDKSFIFDSYSCRFNKGTHKAVGRLETFARKLSRNHKKNIFILKCDIRKFFDSVQHQILTDLIRKKIKDENLLWLVKLIIGSFKEEKESGLPLGNVTSQLFVNIYLNELDHFIKHELKIKYYIRYCDDFIILSESKGYLMSLTYVIGEFLFRNLNLYLHGRKIIVRKYSQGIDFLGYVVLPHYRALRTKTKRRIFKKLVEIRNNSQSLQSYLGVLKHCSGFKMKKILENRV